MVFADLPPEYQERTVCAISAAVKYQIPANIVLAVAEKEGGKPGQWVKNSNGTHDVGPMQFNTTYLTELTRYGITPNHVAANGYFSFDLAAWRLREHIRNDKGDLWTRAANYHSRTYRYNGVYRVDLITKAGKWADWLDARFVTYDAMKQSALAIMPTTNVTTTSNILPAQQLVKPIVWSNSEYVARKLITNRTA